jgi:hypothetical protein
LVRPIWSLHFCSIVYYVVIYCLTSHCTKQSTGQTVLSYVNMVCSTLRNSIPKSIVYCQVREAKRSLLDHFFTELGAREVRSVIIWKEFLVMFLYYHRFHNFIILPCSPCLFVHSTYCSLLVLTCVLFTTSNMLINISMLQTLEAINPLLKECLMRYKAIVISYNSTIWYADEATFETSRRRSSSHGTQN